MFSRRKLEDDRQKYFSLVAGAAAKSSLRLWSDFYVDSSREETAEETDTTVNGRLARRGGRSNSLEKYREQETRNKVRHRGVLVWVNVRSRKQKMTVSGWPGLWSSDRGPEESVEPSVTHFFCRRVERWRKKRTALPSTFRPQRRSERMRTIKRNK